MDMSIINKEHNEQQAVSCYTFGDGNCSTYKCSSTSNTKMSDTIIPSNIRMLDIFLGGDNTSLRLDHVQNVNNLELEYTEISAHERDGYHGNSYLLSSIYKCVKELPKLKILHINVCSDFVDWFSFEQLPLTNIRIIFFENLLNQIIFPTTTKFLEFHVFGKTIKACLPQIQEYNTCII